MEIVQDKWKEILQRVRDEHELSEISFTTWIEPLTIHSVEDNLITILVPSEKMGLDYVSKKYTLPIKVQSRKSQVSTMRSALFFRKK